MVIHSARPQAAGTTQNNPLKTNGPKKPDPSKPCGWRPTIVHVSVGRYRCPECAHVWRQDMSQAADPRAKLSRVAVRWALTGVVVHHVTVARVAQAVGVSWKSR